MTNCRIRDLLHADRVWRLMAAGLSLQEAADMDDESASYMLEAWDIAMSGDDGDEGVVIRFVGPSGGE